LGYIDSVSKKSKRERETETKRLSLSSPKR
jgi:hypothetical protein